MAAPGRGHGGGGPLRATLRPTCGIPRVPGLCRDPPVPPRGFSAKTVHRMCLRARPALSGHLSGFCSQDRAAIEVRGRRRPRDSRAGGRGASDRRFSVAHNEEKIRKNRRVHRAVRPRVLTGIVVVPQVSKTGRPGAPANRDSIQSGGLLDIPGPQMRGTGGTLQSIASLEFQQPVAALHASTSAGAKVSVSTVMSSCWPNDCAAAAIAPAESWLSARVRSKPNN